MRENMLTAEQFQELSAEDQECYLKPIKKKLEEINEKFNDLRDRLKNCVARVMDENPDIGSRIQKDPEYIRITKEIKELNEKAVSIMFK